MRIFITGPTGSGKTTLARHISLREPLPLYSLDDIHWIRHPEGDRRRDADERLAMLDRLAQQNDWVIEGVQFKWADAAIQMADHIIVLDVPRWRNIGRILRRFMARQFSTVPDQRGKFVALQQELKWSRDYYDSERAMLFAKLERWTSKVTLSRGSVNVMGDDRQGGAIGHEKGNTKF